MTGPSHELPDDPRLAALDADDMQRYREHGCPGDLDDWLYWLHERRREEEAIRTLPAELGLTENWSRVFRTLLARLDLLEILPGLQPSICGDPVSVLPSILATVGDHSEPGLDRERLLMQWLTTMECWTYRVTSRRTGERFDLRTETFRSFLARNPAHELAVEITPGEPIVSSNEAFSWIRRELYRGGKG